MRPYSSHRPALAFILIHFETLCAPPVFNTAALKQYFASHHIEIERFANRYGAQGYSDSFYIHDPEGNEVELVVTRYCIGALTRPELELLQCLVYGLCSQYLQAEGNITLIALTEDIELAYQDTLKISVWMRRLFSQNHQNQAILSFDVNDKAEVQLVYRRTGSKNVPGVFGYVGIVIAQDRFDYDSFVAFCASTHAPLPGMDINAAQSIHHLLCQNILFLLNMGTVAGKPRFKFNAMEERHA